MPGAPYPGGAEGALAGAHARPGAAFDGVQGADGYAPGEGVRHGGFLHLLTAADDALGMAGREKGGFGGGGGGAEGAWMNRGSAPGLKGGIGNEGEAGLFEEANRLQGDGR